MIEKEPRTIPCVRGSLASPGRVAMLAAMQVGLAALASYAKAPLLAVTCGQQASANVIHPRRHTSGT
jgi:hypothetical protein